MPIYANRNAGMWTDQRHCPCLLCLALGVTEDTANCEHEIVWAYHFGQAIRRDADDGRTCAKCKREAAKEEGKTCLKMATFLRRHGWRSIPRWHNGMKR